MFLYLCILGPSVFMISLGSNLVFSDAGPRKLAKRGCTTLVAFLLLNITRDVLPDIAIALAGHADAFDVLGYDMLASDILGFAGFTFLFFAIIKYFQISPLATLLISLCMLTVNDLIPQLHLSSQFVSATLGNFFYADDYSCFPLLSWMIFPAIGYALASALRDIPDKDLFWKHVIAVCAIVLVAISVNMRKYGLNPLLIATSPVNDYITDFANVVLDAAIAWIWYGIFHFVYKRIRFARIKHIILCGSQAIMLFYMAQWILVGWIRSALVMLDLEGTNVLTTGTFITLIVVVTAAALPIGLFA